MSITLPDVIKTYFQANNAQDTTAMTACFASDAVVHDEGEEFCGIIAIANWIHETTEKYRATVEVTNVTEQNAELFVTGQVSGNFDGSPIQLEYHFKLEANEIIALTIRA